MKNDYGENGRLVKKYKIGSRVILNSLRYGLIEAKILGYVPHNEFKCEIMRGSNAGKTDSFNILEIAEHKDNLLYLQSKVFDSDG